MPKHNPPFDATALSEKAIASDREHQNKQTPTPSTGDRPAMVIDRTKLRDRYIDLLTRGGHIGC